MTGSDTEKYSLRLLVCTKILYEAVCLRISHNGFVVMRMYVWSYNGAYVIET